MNQATFPRMHVSLYVADIQKTIRFYSAFFGQEAEKIKPTYAKYVLASPSLIISFVENQERVQQHFGHLGFQVETLEELNNYLKRAKDQGLEIREEIGTNCCYAYQDKFWVNDPDGVQWEVYYFHQDADFNDPHYELQEASACCMPASVDKPAIQLASLDFVVKEDACCTPGTGCC
ncbi:ArsI/CadI family heavy metal resistance metalloenzyme [Pontibacter sp. 13R65]|uniref:ArsI/CadI family heavy metal resistance metalloenzyme n=1 Tax=Pontibacter sp. 13R65 TaxID=3127458 RepID=UPI00301E4862